MARVIYKYLLQMLDYQKISMPSEAIILHVGEQDGDIMVWAMVETDNPIESRHFKIYGTGHIIEENARRYIGTVTMRNSFVWHIFEEEN